MIKFLDLQKINARHGDDLSQAVTNVIDSGWYILGASVKNFEEQFAYYIQSNYCIGVGSGLDALVLILQGYVELGKLNIGDKIIVPSNTYIATILAITKCGLEPIFVEPDINTYNLDPDKIKEALDQQVKGIMVVHLYGRPADMRQINELAKENELLVFEDCAQAHGAQVKGTMIGNLSNAGAFSFYPGKNLGALGDGGAVTTNDESLKEMIIKLRNYGSGKKYYNEVVGFNSRLQEMQAACLSVKLQHLDADNERRIEIANQYLAKITNERIILPNDCEDKQVWHVFVVRCQERAELQNLLTEAGIQTVIHYPVPPHKQHAYSKYNDLQLPICEQIHDEVLSLPISPVLEDAEVEKVISTINSF